MKNKTYKCERCGSVLNFKKMQTLELSNTDKNYYVHVPPTHVSQGLFAFGIDCAILQLDETISNLIKS
jgi:hypothetical protein